MLLKVTNNTVSLKMGWNKKKRVGRLFSIFKWTRNWEEKSRKSLYFHTLCSTTWRWKLFESLLKFSTKTSFVFPDLKLSCDTVWLSIINYVCKSMYQNVFKAKFSFFYPEKRQNFELEPLGLWFWVHYNKMIDSFSNKESM